MKKQKRWPRVWPSSSLSSVSSFPYSAEMLRSLSFWPLRLLVQRAVAMLRPMCGYTVEDEGCVRPNLRRERGLGSTIVITPVAIEVRTSSW
jgi:hypothetical protein